MAAYYIYLISSLPMLRFGAKPPFSFSRFLQICREFIPESDWVVLQKVSIGAEYDYAHAANPTLKRWQRFDSCLRNELVRVRAGRKHLDPEKYLRQDKYVDASVAHIAISAYRNPSILEAERMLDEARWQALDEFAAGHYFDLDFLIVYALKLLILERWEKVSSADKTRLIEDTLQRV